MQSCSCGAWELCSRAQSGRRGHWRLGAPRENSTLAEAKVFYERFGFRASPTESLTLTIALAAAKRGLPNDSLTFCRCANMHECSRAVVQLRTLRHSGSLYVNSGAPFAAG